MAAVLDHGADDELRVVGRAVAAPPRLVLEMPDRVAGKVDDLLGRPGLAGDRDRVGAEDAGRRALRRVRAGPEPLLDGLEGGRIDARVTRRRRRELLQRHRLLPVGARLLDAGDDVRRHELAAVRDHRVEARHLQRRHGMSFWPIASWIESPGFHALSQSLLNVFFARRASARSSATTAPRCRCRGPVGAPKPNLRAHCWSAAALGRATLVEAVADGVEVGVARGRERLGQVHRPVDVRIPVLEDLLVDGRTRAGRALDRRVRREQVLLHRGERGDRLPGRARRVGDLGDPVEAGEVRRLRGRVVHERRELLRVDRARRRRTACTSGTTPSRAPRRRAGRAR